MARAVTNIYRKSRKAVVVSTKLLRLAFMLGAILLSIFIFIEWRNGLTSEAIIIELADFVGVGKLPMCTEAQRTEIVQQLGLNNDTCDMMKNRYYTNVLCPVNQQTQCPETEKWFKPFYEKNYHSTVSPAASEGQQNSDSFMNYIDAIEGEKNFIALDVGCGDGIAAIEMFRMATSLPAVDSASFSAMMEVKGASREKAVCPRYFSDAAAAKSEGDSASHTVKRSGTNMMHCVEATPYTAQALKDTVESLKMEGLGFVVNNVAIGGDTTTPIGFGTDYRFPKKDLSENAWDKIRVGDGNKNVYSCGSNVLKHKRNEKAGKCVSIKTMTLDEYVEKEMQIGSNTPLNYLKIDTRGFENFIMFNGGQKTLKRTEFLEFKFGGEYGWRDDHQTLDMAISTLDGYGFNCYWMGKDNKLWRITNCWLDQYDRTRLMGRVACVHRSQVFLGFMMEHVFADYTSGNVGGDPPDEPEDPPGEPEDPPGEPEDPPDKPEDPPDKPEDPPGEPEDPPDKLENPPGETEDPPGEPEDPPDEPEDPPDEPEEK
eukprot:CAMPEP_0196824738 /NCGR_PEP_ID=MMETSP1362-20130617/92657_1 /TAXON_ID=163516 /ORGANISM="Leptocylindrus danicus, Strain CCMP1856" /LENGTH=540 /DNA_ID=CAMNT_0042205069 /DNA_START=46 /DNA_END=1668 /DNA_ORIENTATION=-